MTHKQRNQRRSEMRALVAKGTPRHEVATKFGVSVGTVNAACGKLRSRCNDKPGFNNYHLMYDILNTKLPYSMLARKYERTRQRVAQVAEQLAKAGFKFPARPRGGLLAKYRNWSEDWREGL